ncbi:hypothetical protein [Streptomyces sp. NPDC018059]|uniref:hypothetical protein n=1 Tax=Streptomyces sp. NPDC018059 TaxID=3365041 RepID=UPI0037959B4E
MRKALAPTAYEAAEKATKQDLHEARSRLLYLEELIDIPVEGVQDLAAWWKTAPRTWQRALLGVMIVKVLVLAVGRGRHRDPSERIRIEWLSQCRPVSMMICERTVGAIQPQQSAVALCAIAVGVVPVS